jgi:hypothetical protein
MVRIARAVLVYLLAVLMITGCGAGAATRGGGAAANGPSASTETGTAAGESGAPAPGTETATGKTDSTTQVIAFKTEPPGANIIIDGKDRHTSPAEICLACNVDHSYEIDKDGYEKANGTINSVRDYKEKSKVPGKVGAFVATLLLAGAMGALAGVAMAAGAPVVPIITPNIKAGHPGYTAGPPRLEPDKIEVTLEPESP